ncbi:MAG: TIGR03618 family F420-dependent PPOX class oxidoreductase [Chloroflexota bacterium]
MSMTIPVSHIDLIKSSLVVTLITTMPDGQPHGSVVWCRLHGTQIQISITDDTQKYRNLVHESRVSIVAIDTTDPFRYVEVRGTVSMSRENTREILREIATIYGRPDYDVESGADKRVILTITPTKVITHG